MLNEVTLWVRVGKLKYDPTSSSTIEQIKQTAGFLEEPTATMAAAAD